MVRGVSIMELDEHTVSALRLNVKNADDREGVHGIKVREQSRLHGAFPNACFSLHFMLLLLVQTRTIMH